MLSLACYNDNTMIRTQISLNKKEYQEAKKFAKELGISLAEFFRRALESFILKSDNENDKPWMKYKGFVSTGKSHTNEDIDEIVYGSK